MLEGPTEVRWAFKYNDLRPRVYFARGPNQYYASRYIQQVFNTIIDAFPMTHRFSRFLTDIVRIAPDATLFIYDYSCFTSKLHEIRNFTSALSRFYTGTEITVIDSYEGPVTIDLGQLLAEFNDTCNLDPVFDLGALNLLHVYGGEDLEIHNCGMLGVPGNISSCTLLHGLHLAILVCDMLACKCVGDDALGVLEIEDAWAERDLVDKLSGIGDISLPKTLFWHPGPEEDDNINMSWHYTKRPILRSGSRVVTKWQPIFPPLAVIVKQKDQYHTTIHAPTAYGHIRKIVGFLVSFCLQFLGHESEIDEEDLQFIDLFIGSIRGYIWHLAEEEKLIRQVKKLSVPSSIGYEGIEEMIYQVRDRVIMFPYAEDSMPWTEEIIKETVCVGRSSKALRLARDLGYAKVDKKERLVLGEDVEDDLRRLYSGRFVALYDFEIYPECPDWLVDLIHVEHHSHSALDAITEVATSLL